MRAPAKGDKARRDYIARNSNSTWGIRTWDAKRGIYVEGAEYKIREGAREVMRFAKSQEGPSGT